ncbi:oligosaccharide flippase family protein [Aquimarina pacifica]|uniref:oligosaccharide flippase family protein n=1 Tax=Aquimarina pacifica TaxID=1296415 RepID=UPI00047052F5|nr:polysaccharide biosynthesis C-terminal domain-containing protein [Aquimarina pacifica]
MGVVVNQTIKNVIVTCLGFGIGAINTLFLFTNFMQEEYYGLIMFLLSTASLVWPLMAFGVHNTLVKFFSSYTDTQQQDRFLTLVLFLPIGMALFLGVFGTLFYKSILEFLSKKNTIVAPYVWAIFVLAFAMSYFEVFFAWSKVKLKSVFGNLMKELFLRVCTSILLLLLYYQVLSVRQFIYFMVGAYVVRMIIMKFYAFRLHPLKLRFRLPNNYKVVLQYSLLILIAGSVATLLLDLDKTMIGYYLPIENVAKYGMCGFIASVIIIPSRAMHQITYPLTAKLINEKSMDQLHVLYKKSSINLLITSGLLFVLILCNVNQLFEIIPDQYELLIWIIILIGSAKLFDNTLGNTNSILFCSDYYRLVLFIGIGIAVLAFVLNTIFITTYGITGAGIATFLTIVCYNIIKLFIVYTKFRIHPFSPKTWLGLLIVLIFVFGFYFWDLPFYPLVNIAIKSILIGICYTAVLYVLKVSEDVNVLIKNFIQKIWVK